MNRYILVRHTQNECQSIYAQTNPGKKKVTSVPLDAVMLLGLNTKLPPAATSTCEYYCQHRLLRRERQTYIDLAAGTWRRRWCGNRSSNGRGVSSVTTRCWAIYLCVRYDGEQKAGQDSDQHCNCRCSRVNRSRGEAKGKRGSQRVGCESGLPGVRHLRAGAQNRPYGLLRTCVKNRNNMLLGKL